MTRSLPSSRVFAVALVTAVLVVVGVAYGVVRATSGSGPAPSHVTVATAGVSHLVVRGR